MRQLAKLPMEVESKCGNPPCETIIPAGEMVFVLIQQKPKKRGIKMVAFCVPGCLDAYQSSRSGIPRIFKDLLFPTRSL